MSMNRSYEYNRGKYGHLISEAWRWSVKTDIAMADQCLERWDERTPWGSVSPGICLGTWGCH